jgi:uncharacterized membrane protein YuzA (DUF378 family)
VAGRARPGEGVSADMIERMNPGETLPARRRAVVSYVMIPLLALIALVSWGLASPVGASPDDDFHLSSTWCGSGLSDECEAGDNADERSVSMDIIGEATCYAGAPLESADCQREGIGEDLSERLTSTSRGNFWGLYPPVYYFVMSQFAGEDLQSSVVVMRIASSMLLVGMMTALFALLPPLRRPTLVLALAVSVVPFGMFLIPSNNPSGWAIISAATLWIALLGFFETTGRRRIGLGALALVATVVGAGARADSAIYAVVAVAAVLILKFRFTRRSWTMLILPAVISIIAVLWFFSGSQSAAASEGLGAGAERYSLYVLVIQNFTQMPGLWMGVFGGWGLGWIDTALPAIVPFAAFGAYAGALFIGFGTRYPRKTLASAFVLVVLVTVPLVILFRSQLIVGQGVQPRYILPLVVLLAGIALTQPVGRVLTASRAHVMIIAGALSAANAVALHTNIRRYVTGTDVTGGNLDNGVEWWWDIVVSPMTVWAIGSLAFAAVVFWLGLLWLAQIRSTALAESTLVAPERERELV